MKNYYRILGLGVDAEHEEIKAAYKILAQRYHPDKGGSQAEFILIQEAYNILINPLTKRAYDQDLLKYLKQPAGALLLQPANCSVKWLSSLLVGLFAGGTSFFTYWAYEHYYRQNQQPIAMLTAPTLAPSITPHHHHPASTTAKNHLRPHKPAAASSASATVNQDNPLADLSGTNYLINVGSFSSLAAAQQKQASLKQQGFNSSTQHINASSEGLASYNVFIGPYRNSDNAYRMLERLESANIDANVERVDFN